MKDRQMQPRDFRGQLPDVRDDGYWPTDETQAWPPKRMARPTHLVSQREPADWRDTRLGRTTVTTFCLAAIVASVTLIIVSLRIVWLVWPR
jgi:hypothetical protein